MVALFTRLVGSVGGWMTAGEGDLEDQTTSISEAQLQEWLAEQEHAELKWAGHVSQLARDWAKKPADEPLREEDFFFDMISTEHVTTDAQKYFGWCMDFDHPIAAMMRQTYLDQNHHIAFAPFGVLQTKVGTVVMYGDGQIDQCVKDVVLLCQKYGLYQQNDSGISLPETPTPLEIKKTD